MKAGLLAGRSPGAAGPNFFGLIPMAREFWAEDPSWTNPGNGNSMALTVWRDNGTIGADLAASSKSGGQVPTYYDSLIDGKPGVDFGATTNTVGGALRTSVGTVSTPMTVVVLGRVDVINGTINAPYMADAVHGSIYAAIGALNSGSQWTTYHNAALNLNGGSWDSSHHLFELVIKDNDYRFYVDGSLVGTDSSGTAASVVTGISLGIDRADAGSCLDGAISYAAHYEGDLTAHADHAAFRTAIMDYYGI